MTTAVKGQAGAEFGFMAGMERRPVISLRDEIAFWNCLTILFQRQSWIKNVWHIINNLRITLPKLEISLNNEKILVVFFEKGKMETLSERVKEFARIAVILDGWREDKEDHIELSRLGSSANNLGKRLIVIDGQKSDIQTKFSYFSSVCEMGKILGQFCKELEKGLDSYLCYGEFAFYKRLGRDN